MDYLGAGDVIRLWLWNTAMGFLGLPVVAGVTYLAWRFRG